jgi:phosphinothricin acetyltransferase
METVITALQPGHWPQVRAIYLEGIATGEATFETVVPSWEKWDANHLPLARLAAFSEKDAGTLIGWAALSPVSTRAVYAGVAEVSVYVAKAARAVGVGRELLERLVQESEARGIWTLQASIFLENKASVQLHTSCGFRQVGVRERIGKLDGVWRDTLLLERRSQLAGLE